MLVEESKDIIAPEAVLSREIARFDSAKDNLPKWMMETALLLPEETALAVGRDLIVKHPFHSRLRSLFEQRFGLGSSANRPTTGAAATPTAPPAAAPSQAAPSATPWPATGAPPASTRPSLIIIATIIALAAAILACGVLLLRRRA
jgi:hypothetical protein